MSGDASVPFRDASYPRRLSPMCAWLALAWLLCLPAWAQVVIYQNNSATAPLIHYTTAETGDEVTLANGQPRTVSEFAFIYFGDIAEGSRAQAIVRFYRNDHTVSLPGGKTIQAPGTLLYESQPVSLKKGTTEAVFSGLAIQVPASFTWTVLFTGLSGTAGDRAGLLLEDPPTTGSSFDDYWAKQEGSWGVYRLDGAVANFGALILAPADPVTLPAFKPVSVPKDTSTEEIRFSIQTSSPDTAASLTVTAVADNSLLVPPGAIALNGSGLDWRLKITPAAGQSGVANITVRAADAKGFVATSGFLLRVTDAASPISITLIPDQRVTLGQPIELLAFQVLGLDTEGGFDSAEFKSSNPALVPDFNLTPDGDLHTGKLTLRVTPLAGATGETTISIRIRAKSGASGVTTFKVTVSPPPELSIVAQSLSAGGVGKSYRVTLQAAGGVPPYDWQLAEGKLPDGLQLDASTGVLAGTPNAAGPFSFTVAVQDSLKTQASRKFVLEVTGEPFITKEPADLTLTAGLDAVFEVAAEGAGPLSYQWYFNGEPIKGEVTPKLLIPLTTSLNTGSYVAMVTNQFGSVISRLARLVVTASPPVITTSELPEAATGLPYTSALQATGGSAPFTWALASGRLPGGLVLDAATGQLSGTPAAAGDFDFTARATDRTGRFAERTLKLRVVAPPLITRQPVDQVVAPGEDAQFSVEATGADPLAYQWFFKGQAVTGAHAASLPLPKVTAAQAGGYFVVVSHGPGAVTSRVATLAVRSLAVEIVAAELPAAALGEGFAFQFQAINGVTPLVWSLGEGNLPRGLGIDKATGKLEGTPGEAGSFQFTVKAKDGSGRQAERKFSLLVTAKIVIARQPADVTVVAGGNVEFKVEVNGLAPINYQWFFQGKPVAIASSQKLSLARATALEAGEYFVVVSNPLGALTSRVARLTVNAPPLAIVPAELPDVLAGVPLAYNFQAQNGTAPLVWSEGGGKLPDGVTLDASGRLAGTPSREGSFSFMVDVRDAGGATAQRTFALRVFAPPVITRQPADATVPAGKNAEFSVEAGGTAPLVYRWFFRDLPLPAATEKTLTLPKVATIQAGDYSVMIANPFGAVTSRLARLSVGAPVLDLPDTDLPVASFNEPYAFVLTALNGVAPLVWSVSGGELPPGVTLDRASGRLGGTPTREGSFGFAVLVQDSGGQKAEQSLKLLVASKPVIVSEPEDVSSFRDETVRFAVAVDGARPLGFQWRFDNNPVPNETNDVLTLRNLALNQAGDYSVVITNKFGLATSRSAKLSVGLPIPRVLSTELPVLTLGQPLQFTLQGTKGTPPYAWSLPGGHRLPAGLALDPATGRLSGVPAKGGVFELIVRISDSLAVNSDQVLFLTVLAPPVILTQPAGATLQLGQSTRFAVEAEGAKPMVFQWMFNENPIAGADQKSHPEANVQPGQEGNYTVVITNIFGAVTSQVARLTVLVAPVVVTQPQPRNVPPGATVTFTAGVEGLGPFRYQWQLNGANIAGATAPTLTLTGVTPVDSGDYSVMVASEHGVTTSAPARLTVDLPVLALANNFADRVRLATPAGAGRGANLNADREPGEPNHGGLPGRRSVWVAWVAPGTGVATLATAGSSFDTTLAVYAGNDLRSLVPVASDGDSGGFGTSFLTFNMLAGAEYQIAIDGFGGASGDAVLTWSLDLAAPPAPVIQQQPVGQTVLAGATARFTVGAINPPGAVGPLTYQWYHNGGIMPGETLAVLTISSAGDDDLGAYYCEVDNGSVPVFSDLVTLQLQADTARLDDAVSSEDKFLNTVPPGGLQQAGQAPRHIRRHGGALARGYTSTQVFNSYGSTTEEGEPNHCGVIGGASQWFSYLAEADGLLTITTQGSDFDTILAVYTSPAGVPADFESLQLVACDNDGGPDGRTSLIRLEARAGTVYYLAVDGVQGATGNVKLTYNLTGATSLTLNGAPLAPPRLQFASQIGRNYRVQTSTNLLNWAELISTNAVIGTVNFADPGAGSFSNRFYRVFISP